MYKIYFNWNQTILTWATETIQKETNYRTYLQNSDDMMCIERASISFLMIIGKNL